MAFNFIFQTSTPSLPGLGTAFPPPPVLTFTPPIPTTGGGGSIIIGGSNSSTVATPSSIGGNTGSTQVRVTGHVDSHQPKRSIGTLGKIMCGLFIVAALRKVWNFIFKTAPATHVGINMNGKTLRQTSSSGVVNVIDAVLDAFDLATKMQNLYDSLSNTLDGSNIGDHCVLFVQIPSTTPLPKVCNGKDIADFSSMNVGAYDTFYNNLIMTNPNPTVSQLITAYNNESGLGGLLVKVTTKEINQHNADTRTRGNKPVGVIRFYDQSTSGFTIDPKCLINLEHLPPDIIKSIVEDEALFRALLGKTKGANQEQKDCLNDCGVLLVELCACYTSESCDGYIASEKSFDGKSCSCTKTQIVTTFETDYYKDSTGPNKLKSFTERMAVSIPAELRVPFNSNGQLSKQAEKQVDNYYGVKVRITTETDADEGGPVLTPDCYGPNEESSTEEDFEDENDYAE